MNNANKKSVNLGESDKIKRIVLSNPTRLTLPENESKSKIAYSNEFITTTQLSKELGRQSNLLAQIDEEDTNGGNIEDFLQQKLVQSFGSWRNASSAIVELKAYFAKTNDTLETIVADLLYRVQEENRDITKQLKSILQGISNDLQKDRPCPNCKETGKKMVNNRWIKCKSCHGTLVKPPNAQRSRKIYLSQIRDVFRFYGLLNNVNEKNLILKQPKQLKEKKYALEKKTAIKIVANTNTSMRRTLLQFLCMTGMRIAEAVHIRPEYFSFVDEKGEKTTKDKMFRMRVDLPAKITKNKTERYVLVHKDIQEAVLRLVENTSAKTKWQKHSNPNEYVFHTAISASSAENNEERAFTDQRKRMINDGFEEMGLKYETGRHKITLHTMRSMFITIANRVSGSDLAGDFGDNIADHNDGSMKAIYDRMPENMVMELWLKAEPLLSFENQADEQIDFLREEISILQKQSEQNETDTQRVIQEMNERHIEEMADIQVKTMEALEKRFELKKKSK